MSHSNYRLLTAVLTAAAIFGASASVATAGTDRAISNQMLKIMPAPAEQTIGPALIAKPTMPDLRVKSWSFGPDNGAKYVTVKLRNDGLANTQPSVLRLTVRRIDGTPVGRTVEVNVPAFVGKADYFVSIATANILPNAVHLKDTTFRLDADATNTNFEYDETNNTSWHNF